MPGAGRLRLWYRLPIDQQSVQGRITTFDLVGLTKGDNQSQRSLEWGRLGHLLRPQTSELVGHQLLQATQPYLLHVLQHFRRSLNPVLDGLEPALLPFPHSARHPKTKKSAH